MRSLSVLLLGLAIVGTLRASAQANKAETEPALGALVFRPGERQLFLDDFVIGDLNGLTRVIHQPRKFEGNPVIRPDLPTDGQAIQVRDAPAWDEAEKVWKVWYFRYGDDGNGAGAPGFARSKDGIHWEKPVLGLVESFGNRNNNLATVKDDPEAFIQHVIIEPNAPPARRYKGLTGTRGSRPGREPLVSADGFTFTRLPVPPIQARTSRT